MKRLACTALVFAALLAPAAAQDTPPPRNGVITPSKNVDPGMKVVPPRTPTTMPVVKPPGAPNGKHHGVVLVPK